MNQLHSFEFFQNCSFSLKFVLVTSLDHLHKEVMFVMILMQSLWSC